MRHPVQLSFIVIVFGFFIFSLMGGGCAQIGVPTGGPQDTLAPKLIRSSPEYGSLNVQGNRVTLEFDEYIDVQDLQQNLIISPLQVRNPSVVTNPRSISLKFRDSLLPNTTYTINFGNAVRDINENNVYKGLTYTFSTGNTLDSLSLAGQVTLAETGETDSTLFVLLYRNAADTTVLKKRPNYVARVAGDGSFRFTNLPDEPFSIYALKDGDGGKTYNSLSEIFAFTGSEVRPGQTDDIMLYAYAQEKAADTRITPTATRAPSLKTLRMSPDIQGTQDLLYPLQLSFNNPLETFDSTKIRLTDTLFNDVRGVTFSLDSTAKRISVNHKWLPATDYILVVDKDAVKDSAGVSLIRSDTIQFASRRTEDYGKLVLRFVNADLSRKPVIQFLLNGTVRYSYPLKSSEWSDNMFPPGEYGLRILYDTDGNGKFTPGNYAKKQQPEIAVTLPQTVGVRADWENEREINL